MAVDRGGIWQTSKLESIGNPARARHKRSGKLPKYMKAEKPNILVSLAI